MKLERIINSKPYRFLTNLWNLFVINLWLVVLAAPIITFLPALTAAVMTFENLEDPQPEFVTKTFFRNFGRCFKRTVIPGLIFVEVVGLLLYGLFIYAYFNPQDGSNLSALLTIGFFVTVGLLAVALLVFIQLPFSYTYFYLRIFDNFYIAFFTAFKFILRNLIFILLVVVSGLVLFYLLPLWFFLGLVGPLFALYKAIAPIYRKSFKGGEENDEVRD